MGPKRKKYLGPDAHAHSKVPRTSEWRLKGSEEQSAEASGSSHVSICELSPHETAQDPAKSPLSTSEQSVNTFQPSLEALTCAPVRIPVPRSSEVRLATLSPLTKEECQSTNWSESSPCNKVHESVMIFPTSFVQSKDLSLPQEDFAELSASIEATQSIENISGDIMEMTTSPGEHQNLPCDDSTLTDLSSDEDPPGSSFEKDDLSSVSSPSSTNQHEPSEGLSERSEDSVEQDPFQAGIPDQAEQDNPGNDYGGHEGPGEGGAAEDQEGQGGDDNDGGHEGPREDGAAQDQEGQGGDDNDGGHEGPREDGAAQDIQDQEGQGADDNAEAGHNYDQHPSHPKLRRRMQGDFDPIIETHVNVSRNDALYMTLGLARRENFSNTAFCNAVNLINAVFAAPVLPSTIDLLDGLLISDLGVKYFFFCRICTKLFGELNYKIVKSHTCPSCGTRNLISDLRVAHFFVIFDIPHQLQNMFQDPSIANALLSPAEAIAKSRAGLICEIWDGTIYKEFAAAVADFACRVFSFHFCVDGTPLAVSSLLSIWPLLLALSELPAALRMSNILLGGLWFGTKPAKMDLFLDPLVTHYRELGEAGFNLKIGPNIEHARAFCIGCCVDSGARGKVQGIKTHSGYYSCNWCTICGVWRGGAVRFPLGIQRDQERTHQDIVRLQNVLMNNPLPDGEENPLEDEDDPGIREGEQELLGVNAVSPLINLPYFGQGANRSPSFNMIDGFFVDSMHMLDLGVAKFFLTRWMEDYGHDYYIKESSAEVDRRIKALRPPLEFRRLPRALSERARFNARECQNWMMFCCVPVLTGILRDNFLKVWLLLIQAVYLLNQNEISHEDLENADTLLNLFLIQTQEYYDIVDMTFNLHILKHLVAHTIRNGPSWATNAYCFENMNGVLKKIIHSNQGVPHQVIRSLSWGESMKILEGHVSQKAKNYVLNISQSQQQRQISLVVGSVRLVGKQESTQLSPEEEYQCESHGHDLINLECYKKVIHKNCAFTDDRDRSIRYDNSIAMLNDKSVIIIRRIIFDSDKNEVFLLVSNIDFNTILVPPVGLRIEKDSHFMRMITTIHEELKYIKCTDLYTICFRASMPHGDFLAPFPNVYNRY